MHYRDGQEAKLGDFIKGKPYNTPHEISGVVVGLVANQDTCNLRVAFLEVERGERDSDGQYRHAVPFIPPSRAGAVGSTPGVYCGSGTDATLDPPSLIWPCVDYGETRAFELVGRGR